MTDDDRQTLLDAARILQEHVEQSYLMASQASTIMGLRQHTKDALAASEAAWLIVNKVAHTGAGERQDGIVALLDDLASIIRGVDLSDDVELIEYTDRIARAAPVAFQPMGMREYAKAAVAARLAPQGVHISKDHFDV